MLREIAGRYRIQNRLGSGAWATVYEALDTGAIERRVAIKVFRLPPLGDAAAAEEHARFRQGARAAGRLSHPNVVSVFDYGEDDESAWIVMELVEGETLKSVMDRGERLDPAAITRIMGQILDALGYTHSRGVVHRDIKPANIMLTRDGVVKITDFGVARIEDASMTHAGTVLGSPSYMAPEQFRGDPVDHRADIWAAGIILYQLLTGERPFEGSVTSVMQKALHVEPMLPSRTKAAVPVQFDAIVARALAKRPEARFSSAAEFAAALRTAALRPEPRPTAAQGIADEDATLVITSADQALLPRRPLPRRRRGLLLIPVATLGIVALLGLGGILLLPEAGEPSRQASRSGREQAPAPSTSPPVSPFERTLPAAQPSQPATHTADAGLPPGTVPPQRPEPRAEDRVADPRPTSAAPPTEPRPDTRVAEYRAPPVAAAPPVPAPELRQEPRVAEPRLALVPPSPPALPDAVPVPPLPGPPPGAVEPPLDLRRVAVAAGAAFQCGVVSASVSVDRIAFRGAAPRSEVQAAQRTISDAGLPPQAAQLGGVDIFDPAYCDVLGGMEESLGAADAPQVTLAGPHPLQEGQVLRLQVRMPDWPAYLSIFALMPQGEAGQLVGTGRHAARASVTLTDPSWEVTAPFGTDLLLAIASDKPLFARRRPPERLDSLASALGPALRSAREGGGRIAAQIIAVHTVPR